jgi:hypothetical protein
MIVEVGTSTPDWPRLHYIRRKLNGDFANLLY